MKDPSKIKVLVACEESQRVCMAFRWRGFEAYSCDIQEPSGGHPEWHILGDAIEAVNGGVVTTMDGQTHDVGKWDLLIAHPPCTYLSNVATRHYSLRCTPAEKVCARLQERTKAAVFFMRFALADIPHIAVENPVGIMNAVYNKPDQINSSLAIQRRRTGQKVLRHKSNLPVAQGIVAVDAYIHRRRTGQRQDIWCIAVNRKGI